MITLTPPAAIAVRPCRAHPQLLLWPAICIACLPLRHRFVSHQSVPGSETGNETPPPCLPVKAVPSATKFRHALQQNPTSHAPRSLPTTAPSWAGSPEPLLDFAARPLVSQRLRPKMLQCCKHRVCNMQHFPFAWFVLEQKTANKGMLKHRSAILRPMRAKMRQHFAPENVATFSGCGSANLFTTR